MKIIIVNPLPSENDIEYCAKLTPAVLPVLSSLLKDCLGYSTYLSIWSGKVIYERKPSGVRVEYKEANIGDFICLYKNGNVEFFSLKDFKEIIAPAFRLIDSMKESIYPNGL